MKKVVFIIFSVIFLFLISETTSLASSTVDVDSSQVINGIVRVKFNTGTTKKVKLLISKGEQRVQYNLSNSEAYIGFPLQLGDGTYTVGIYENTTDNKYRAVHTKSFYVTITDTKKVYLNSVQEISWRHDSQAVLLAGKLLQEATLKKQQSHKNMAVQLTEREKVNVLYNYVVNNISYDYNKIKTLNYDYLPNIDQTILDKSGICYDYSALLGGMLRSQGIPTKMAKGYTTWTSVYHAWNEVYLASENRWVVVDATYDAYMKRNNQLFAFEKDTSVYQKVKEL